jgi:hypothetical protein
LPFRHLSLQIELTCPVSFCFYFILKNKPALEKLNVTHTHIQLFIVATPPKAVGLLTRASFCCCLLLLLLLLQDLPSALNSARGSFSRTFFPRGEAEQGTANKKNMSRHLGLGFPLDGTMITTSSTF